jgi:muramoyltetrapeptide carboxypeptidase
MIERRGFLAGVGAALVSSPGVGARAPQSYDSDGLTRPRRLRPGDTVGLVTPSTPASDPDLLALGVRTAKHFGLRPKLGKYVGKRSGYFGSPAAERLDDLHAMFRDPEVRGVFALRGGYGAMHLLDRVDYDLIRKNPKVFLGYSDITALHLAIQKNARLVTLHGPTMLSDFSNYTVEHLKRALFDAAPLGKLTNPLEANELRPEHTLRTVVPGRATGRLVGGNLTLISTLMGTPYEVETRGKIFLIEDVGEEPYRIDRYLTQLKLAGKFDGAAGVVFGECVECGPRDYKPSIGSAFSLGEVVDAVLGDLKIPVLAGLTFGHTTDQMTLPLGVRATLDADAGTLEIKESALLD